MSALIVQMLPGLEPGRTGPSGLPLDPPHPSLVTFAGTIFRVGAQARSEDLDDVPAHPDGNLCSLSP